MKHQIAASRHQSSSTISIPFTPKQLAAEQLLQSQGGIQSKLRKEALDVHSDDNEDSFNGGDSLMLDDDDDDEAGVGDISATNTQLFKIERKIQQGTDLSKRERRLLQNRKSALKCRLKKQNELDKMKRMVDRLTSENRELKEKVRRLFYLFPFKSCPNGAALYR